MRTWTIGVGLVLVVGCSERVALSETGATSTGEASATDPASGATGELPTSGGPTSESGGGSTGGESSGTSASGTSTGAVSTSGGDTSTSGGDTSTGAGGTSGSTGAPLEGCASACDRTSMHVGNINLAAGDDTDWLKCVNVVVGDIFVDGAVDAGALAGLVDLQVLAGVLTINDNPVLTDLGPLGCLRSAGEVQILGAPALTDMSALAGLEDTRLIFLRATGLTGLPELPALTGLQRLMLFGNPALTDLTGAGTWKISSDEFALAVRDNPVLADLVGVEGLFAQAKDTSLLSVEVYDSPALTSLAGLETLTHGDLVLSGLPGLTELEALAGYVHAGSVTLSGMPGLGSLHGLHNLQDVTGLFELGDCLSVGPGVDGMDGLVDLSGLDALVHVAAFGVANNDAMVGLGGAPKLQQVGLLAVMENAKLTQAAVDALLGQLDQAPGNLCFGDWEMCSCYELLPW